MEITSSGFMRSGLWHSFSQLVRGAVPALLFGCLIALTGCAADDGLDPTPAPRDATGETTPPVPADVIPADDVAGRDTHDPDTSEEVEDVAPAPPCPLPPPAEGTVRARLLECEEELPSGPMVSALTGDVVLENAVARFVVRARPEGVAVVGLTGGNLIDAVRLDGEGRQAGRDGLFEYVMGASFHLLDPNEIEIVDDGGGGVARVRVSGELVPFETIQAVLPFPVPQVLLAHEYVLYPDSSVIEAWSHADLPEDAVGPRTLTLTDIMLWGGEEGLFLPGYGFEDLPETASAPLIGLAPRAAEWQSPAYAAGAPVGRTLINAGAILALLYDPVVVPLEGAEVVRYLALGGDDGRSDLGASLAAVRARFAEELVPVAGVVSESFVGVEVEIGDDRGRPLARLSADETGAFSGEVPAAARQATAVWIGDGAGGGGGVGQRGHGAECVAEIPEGGTTDLSFAAPPTATLRATVTDSDGAPSPFRLTAAGTGEQSHLGSRYFVSATGAGEYMVPPGSYDLWLSRGPEFDMYHTAVALEAGQVEEIDAVLRHVVRNDGWVSTDLHVHSEYSTDSGVRMARRVIEALAEGVDYLVASEHDYVADYGPYLAGSEAEGRLLVRSGVEISTMHLGHFNLWPLVPDPELGGFGAPRWFGLSMEEFFTMLRTDHPEGIIQCNHPRFGGGYATYFGAIDLGPETPPELLDCDLLEVINAIGHADTAQVLEDWLGILERGVFMTATGVSDSHTSCEFLGSARTLVYVGDEVAGAPNSRVTQVSPEQIEAALLAGRAIATAGPFVEVSLEANGSRAGIGETLRPEEGLDQVTAIVRLEAPEWMALGTLELRADGDETLLSEDLSELEAQDGLKRFESEVALVLEGRERFVVAYHRGASATRPLARRPPLAVTNPVFVVLPDSR